jgi:hypothetical protein
MGEFYYTETYGEAVVTSVSYSSIPMLTKLGGETNEWDFRPRSQNFSKLRNR